MKYVTLMLIMLMGLTCQAQYYFTAQDYTDPVVVHKFEIKNGVNFLSWNMYEDPAYMGDVDAVDGVFIKPTLGEYDGLIPDAFIERPHLLVSREEDERGKYYHIVGNTSDSIQISDPNHTFEVLDYISVIPATRLRDIFLEEHDLIDKLDSLVVWSGFGWKSYRYVNGQWYTAGTRSDQGDAIIYPDQGFVYIRSQPEGFTFWQAGNANLFAKLKIPNKGKKFIIPNPFPVDAPLSQLVGNFNLFESNLMTKADKIAIWQGGGFWKIFYHNGSEWLDEGNIPENPTIESGGSFFIMRSDEDGVQPEEIFILNPNL